MGVLGVPVIVGSYYQPARLRFGHTSSGILLQPLNAALVAGLVAGKLNEAMVVGVGTQLVHLGVTSIPGDNVPNDPALASAIAISVALGVGMNVEATVALAVPFGVLGVFMDQLRRTINATWVHTADKYTKELDYGGIYRTVFVYPALTGFLIRFPSVFAANFFGQSVMNKVLEVISAWLMYDFEVTGGILPASGLALIIMIIGKEDLIPYFLTGFVAVVYFGAEVVAVTILGIYIVLSVRNKTLSEGAA